MSISFIMSLIITLVVFQCDADADEHEWEKYLLSDNDFFISSALASLDA